MTNTTHLQSLKAKAKRAKSAKAREDIEQLLDTIPTLSDAGKKQARKRLSQIPVSMRLTYVAALKGNSQAKAIKAFCQECVGWDRQEVVNCTAKACPLHPYRPYQE